LPDHRREIVTMKRLRERLRAAVGMALAAWALGGCAAQAPGATSEPTAKQRANAEKQEQLQEMLEKGQR
jgi:hypothetical protein